MNPIKRIFQWLENTACAPAYSGWVLAGISICFFGAAVNTMAGWLYVISGVSFSLLSVAAVLPPRSLVGLTVHRRPITPITAGDNLVVELEIINQSKQSVSLLKVEDILPLVLKQKSDKQPIEQSIDAIAPQNSHFWQYFYPAERRGIYRWQTVGLISGAPLGLFWCRRSRECPAIAIVYPQALPLASCPLIDEAGRDDSRKNEPQGNPNASASEGTVRSLRPYRNGDPIRLVHWRTSARRGELRVREFEMVTGGQDIIIALDSANGWNEENFEQAVISAASLYFYALRQRMNVQLWTAGTGLVRGERAVLETLAAITPLEDAVTSNTPNSRMIWLTENPLLIPSLPIGSRWVLWQSPSSRHEIVNRDAPGLILHQDEQLQLQLQKPLHAALVNNF
jgi:uncharacterized protein (DUF58 family)